LSENFNATPGFWEENLPTAPLMSFVSCHFAVILLLKLTLLWDWYRRWCPTMSNKLVHIEERRVILKYHSVMSRKQMGLFGFHWIKWQRPQIWQVNV
jgi:hypothetical protein